MKACTGFSQHNAILQYGQNNSDASMCKQLVRVWNISATTKNTSLSNHLGILWIQTPHWSRHILPKDSYAPKFKLTGTYKRQEKKNQECCVLTAFGGQGALTSYYNHPLSFFPSSNPENSCLPRQELMLMLAFPTIRDTRLVPPYLLAHCRSLHVCAQNDHLLYNHQKSDFNSRLN